MAVSVVISSNQMHAASQIQDTFEKQGIHNLLLKGCSTRQLYPNPDMRTMNDVDVLYNGQQDKKVHKVMEQLGFQGFQEGRKHDCYDRPPYVRVEMHRQMVAARSPYSKYYRNIWKRCILKEGCNCSYELSATDAFVYNLVHMAEHLEEGGIGIRFVMDVFMFDKCKDVDRDRLKEELETIGLWRLYENVSCLAKMWFAPDMSVADEKQLCLMQQLGDFVLSGRLFGNASDGKALAVQKDGRMGFLIKACFPGYREMCSMYTWLEKWPVLLPWAWFIRGVRSLLFRRGNVKSQFTASRNGDVNRGEQLRELYQKIGYER